MVSEISCAPLAPTAYRELESACEPLLESIQKEEKTDVHTLNKCKEDQTSPSPSVSIENSQHGLNESEPPDGIHEPCLELRQNAEICNTKTAVKGCQLCRKSVPVYCNSDCEPPDICPGDHIEVPMKGRMGIFKHHAIVESFQYLGNGKAKIKVIDVAYKNKKFCCRGEMVIQSHYLQDKDETDLTKVYRVQYPKRQHNECETLQRAKQCLQDFNNYIESLSSNDGQSLNSTFKYHFVFRNCESFAVYCACGTEDINKLTCGCLQFWRCRAVFIQILVVLSMTILLTHRSAIIFKFRILYKFSTTNNSRIAMNSPYGECFFYNSTSTKDNDIYNCLTTFTHVILPVAVFFFMLYAIKTFSRLSSCFRCVIIYCSVLCLYGISFYLNTLLNNVFLKTDWTQLTNNISLFVFLCVVLNLFQSILVHVVVPLFLPKIMTYGFCRSFVQICNYA